MILPLHYVEPTPENLTAVLPRMQWADLNAMVDAYDLLRSRCLDLLMVPDKGFLLVGRDGDRYIVRAILGRLIFGPSIIETIETEAIRIGCKELVLCSGVASIIKYLVRRGYQPIERLPDGQIVILKKLVTHGQQQIVKLNINTDHHDDTNQQLISDSGLIGCQRRSIGGDLVGPRICNAEPASLLVGFDGHLQHA